MTDTVPWWLALLVGLALGLQTGTYLGQHIERRHRQ